MEAALNSMPAKDPAFTTNPSAASCVPSRLPSGHIRQARFLDNEVAFWTTAQAHAAVNGSSSNTPSAVNVHALDGTRCAAYGRGVGAGSTHRPSTRWRRARVLLRADITRAPHECRCRAPDLAALPSMLAGCWWWCVRTSCCCLT
jgi:hypothetical protein